ncbi:vacuolar sorting protein 9 (vps9) domain-containing protein [Besnoitia besnoiti]|uniref:Vacuolar sorting protein 9 (Vps9) domain-containing protein n=1 Tax=Besnoitia besnoiti TaxID=94643 RepID=A0A2A9MQV4_BESBE|nr:vacuolar sorting protein 9 (vps9) domain-containing protein [Besnoitia besnoiti]PFH38747.1 vacuolar sorting protein 9 (vps9) domain-containing protein [Besnoitia besnoiti]
MEGRLATLHLGGASSRSLPAAHHREERDDLFTETPQFLSPAGQKASSGAASDLPPVSQASLDALHPSTFSPSAGSLAKPGGALFACSAKKNALASPASVWAAFEDDVNPLPASDAASGTPQNAAGAFVSRSPPASLRADVRAGRQAAAPEPLRPHSEPVDPWRPRGAPWAPEGETGREPNGSPLKDDAFSPWTHASSCETAAVADFNKGFSPCNSEGRVQPRTPSLFPSSAASSSGHSSVCVSRRDGEEAAFAAGDFFAADQRAAAASGDAPGGTDCGRASPASGEAQGLCGGLLAPEPALGGELCRDGSEKSAEDWHPGERMREFEAEKRADAPARPVRDGATGEGSEGERHARAHRAQEDEEAESRREEQAGKTEWQEEQEWKKDGEEVEDLKVQEGDEKPQASEPSPGGLGSRSTSPFSRPPAALSSASLCTSSSSSRSVSVPPSRLSPSTGRGSLLLVTSPRSSGDAHGRGASDFCGKSPSSFSSTLSPLRAAAEARDSRLAAEEAGDLADGAKRGGDRGSEGSEGEHGERGREAPAAFEEASLAMSASLLASAFSPPQCEEGREEEQDLQLEEEEGRREGSANATSQPVVETPKLHVSGQADSSSLADASAPSSELAASAGAAVASSTSAASPSPSPSLSLSASPSPSAGNAPAEASSASSSASPLSGARRRLVMVGDAEAQMMLSTLMHPDDQESRRFLQQVQQNSAASQPVSAPPATSAGFGWGSAWSARGRGDATASPSAPAASGVGASRFLFRALNFGIPGFRNAKQESRGREELREDELLCRGHDGVRAPPGGAAAEPGAQKRDSRGGAASPNGVAGTGGAAGAGHEHKLLGEDRGGDGGGSTKEAKDERGAAGSLSSVSDKNPGREREKARDVASAPPASGSSEGKSPQPARPSSPRAAASASSAAAGAASPPPPPPPGANSKLSGPGSSGAAKPRTPYNVFLDRLKHPSCSAVVASVKRFVEFFPTNLSRAEAAARIHPFLSQVQAALLRAEVFASAAKTEVDRQQVMEGLERFVLQKLHAVLFRETEEDRAENAALKKKLHCLAAWIEFRHLEVPPLPNASALALGAREIERLDKMRSPRDKLVLILNCCRVIIAVLDSARKASGCSTPPAADDLLPLLIYTLIQAKPGALHSHIQFISFFRHPSRLVSEEAYFFTHFCSAVEFVKMLGKPGVSLNEVSDEMYREKMAQAELEYDRQQREEELQEKKHRHVAGGDAPGRDAERTREKLSPEEDLQRDGRVRQKVNATAEERLDARRPTERSEETGGGGGGKEEFAGVTPAALAAAASALSTLEHLSAASSSSFGRGEDAAAETQTAKRSAIAEEIRSLPLSFGEAASTELKLGEVEALLTEYKEMARILHEVARMLEEEKKEAVS